MNIFLLFSSIVSVIISLSQASCPTVCRCDSRSTVYCNERHLLQIPYGIPETTIVLRLQQNNIRNGRAISENLAALKKLRRLNLYQNKLTSVPSGLASTLEYIDFRGNSIKYVGKSSLKGLSSLKELHLGENNITNQGLMPQVFDGTQNLEVLDLSKNLLSKFPENLPKSLQVLRLNKNRINFISSSATGRLKNLTTLHLSENRIVHTMIVHRALFELSSLFSLDLSGNQLRQIPIGLPPRLEQLLLSSNKLEFLFSKENSQHGSLNSIKTLTNVDLSSNFLKSVEVDAFSELDLSTIELQNNPWQCDCYLHYLKKWLASEKTTISNENRIQCSTPAAFADVSLTTIDEEALRCITKNGLTKIIKVLEVNPAKVFLQWRSPFQTPDPPFVTRYLTYGPMRCKNCSLNDFVSGSSSSRSITSFMESYSSQEFTSSQRSNDKSVLNITVNKLQPDSPYLFCVSDSQQDDLLTLENCLVIKTLPSQAPVVQDNAVFIPLWAIILCLVFILFFAVVVVGIVFVKKKKSFGSKTPPNYSINRQGRYYPDVYLSDFHRQMSYRAQIIQGGYETNLSDRTYAECGPANSISTGQRTLQDSSADSQAEFEVLIGADERNVSSTPVRSFSSPGSDSQESGSIPTNKIELSPHRALTLSSPTYDHLHSYNLDGDHPGILTRTLPARPAIDSGIYI